MIYNCFNRKKVGENKQKETDSEIKEAKQINNTKGISGEIEEIEKNIAYFENLVEPAQNVIEGKNLQWEVLKDRIENDIFHLSFIHLSVKYTKNMFDYFPLLRTQYMDGS